MHVDWLSEALAVLATRKTTRPAHAAAGLDIVALRAIVMIVIDAPVLLALRVIRGHLGHRLLTSFACCSGGSLPARFALFA